MNPFITYGYESSEYFCDRVNDTAKLVKLLTNGNNIALISPRRMGKTGLLHHCFEQEAIKEQYETFLIDIYATKCLADLVWCLGRAIVKKLKPRGQSAIDKFLYIVSSLRTGISFDGMGNASWNIEVGDIKTPEFTLEEIFKFLNASHKPCIVAIDEFQAIRDYPEKNIEALLRTYVQECRNAVFIFSGSQRTIMNQMFTSPNRPFYQSITIHTLGPITQDKYFEFVKHHFEDSGKHIEHNVFEKIYNIFNGTTWYIQKILNELYSQTQTNETCCLSHLDIALDNIIHSYEDTFKDLLYQLPAGQASLLIAICKEGGVHQITGNTFISKYRLNSASSIQKAIKALISKQIVTNTLGLYEPYDKFLAIWVRDNLS